MRMNRESLRRLVSHEFLVPVNSSAASSPPPRADSPQRRDGDKMSQMGGRGGISVKSNSYGFLFQLSCKLTNHSVAKLRRNSRTRRQLGRRLVGRAELAGAEGFPHTVRGTDSVTRMTRKTVSQHFIKTHIQEKDYCSAGGRKKRDMLMLSLLVPLII